MQFIGDKLCVVWKNTLKKVRGMGFVVLQIVIQIENIVIDMLQAKSRTLGWSKEILVFQ